MDIKYSQNARRAFKRVWEKLKAAPNSSPGKSSSPIKKMGRIERPRTPSPPRPRPTRNRRQTERGAAYEKLKAEHPSDADEETDEEKYYWHGTPESEVCKSKSYSPFALSGIPRRLLWGFQTVDKYPDPTYETEDENEGGDMEV